MKKNRKTQWSFAARETAVSVADEPLFQRLLALERRRCERSGERFALLLVDLEGVSPALNSSALDNLAQGIGRMMRETDVTGWYREPVTIGVLLTTLNGADRETLESVVVQKARQTLDEYLSKAQIQQVRISCHLFPDDVADRNTGTDSPDRTFFVDRQKRSLRAVAKRGIDIAGSLAALTLLSPVLATIAILVKCTSEGPIFFRQKRLGHFGQEFTFLKFRSMFVNNDPTIHQEYVRNLIAAKVPGSSKTFKIQNDPRITPLGRFIRKTSLDELPQFINVLVGEMSLVGPRPPIPYEVDSYLLWHRRRVLEVKPGITGVWQVDGRSRTTFDEMVRMDLRYIRDQSLWLDFKILLKTPIAVFWGSGAC